MLPTANIWATWHLTSTRHCKKTLVLSAHACCGSCVVLSLVTDRHICTAPLCRPKCKKNFVVENSFVSISNEKQRRFKSKSSLTLSIAGSFVFSLYSIPKHSSSKDTKVFQHWKEASLTFLRIQFINKYAGKSSNLIISWQWIMKTDLLKMC